MPGDWADDNDTLPPAPSGGGGGGGGGDNGGVISTRTEPNPGPKRVANASNPSLPRDR